MNNQEKELSMQKRHRHHTEETRKKISLANKGRKFSDEWRKNLSIAHKGQVSWRKGKKFVDEKVSREKRENWLKNWKLKNKEKLLQQSRASYKRNIEKKRKASRIFYWANQQKELDRIRFKKYGITGDEFRLILERQGFKCPICNRDITKNLSVDHDHNTNKIRGLICNKCNLAIGSAEDSPDKLRAMADYLEKNKKIYEKA